MLTLAVDCCLNTDIVAVNPPSFDPPTVHTVHPARAEPLYPGIK